MKLLALALSSSGCGGHLKNNPVVEWKVFSPSFLPSPSPFSLPLLPPSLLPFFLLSFPISTCSLYITAFWINNPLNKYSYVNHFIGLYKRQMNKTIIMKCDNYYNHCRYWRFLGIERSIVGILTSSYSLASYRESTMLLVVHDVLKFGHT